MTGLTENMIARKARGGTEISLQLFTVSTERSINTHSLDEGAPILYAGDRGFDVIPSKSYLRVQLYRSAAPQILFCGQAGQARRNEIAIEIEQRDVLRD